MKENYPDHSKKKKSERNKNMDWIQIIVRDKRVEEEVVVVLLLLWGGGASMGLLTDGSPAGKRCVHRVCVCLRQEATRAAAKVAPTDHRPINGDARGKVTAKTNARRREQRKLDALTLVVAA